MAVTQAYSGTSTIGASVFSLPNGSTTLTPITVAGAYQLILDASAMLAGDSYLVQCLEKATGSGDTARVVWEAVLAGVQAGAFVSPAVMLLNGWDMRINKIAGTDRSFKYSIRKA